MSEKVRIKKRGMPAFEPQPVATPKPVKTAEPFKLVPLKFPDLYAIEGGVLFGPASINEPPGSYHYPGGDVMHGPISINEPEDTPITSPSPGPGTGGPIEPPVEPNPIVIAVSGPLSFPENSVEGTVIGVVSATGGTPPLTFTLTNNDGGRFKLVGTSLQVGATPSDEGIHAITVHAVDAVSATANKNVSLTANAVLEPVDNATQAGTLKRIKDAMRYAKVHNPVAFPDWRSDPSNQGLFITVTRSAAHDTALTVSANPKYTPELFQHSPGNRYIFDTGLLVGTANLLPGNGDLSGFEGLTTPPLISGDEQNCYTIDFRVTNAQFIELDMRRFTPDTVPYRVLLNKRYLDRDGFLGSGGQFLKMEFTYPFDGLVTVECQSAGSLFQAVSVDAGGKIGPIMDPEYKMLALGDSITEGRSSGDTMTYINDRWASTFAKLMGMNYMRNGGVGQTGYTNAAGGAHKKLVDQLPELWASGDQYEIVAVANGVNDFQTFPTATVTADALAAWQAIRTAQPNALIIVLGIWGCTYGPSATLLSVENALKAKFDEWADPFSLFIRVSTDPAGPWVSGTGHVGAPTGEGNSDIYVSSDGLHPSRAGGIYNGEKANAAVRAALPAMFTAFGVADPDTWTVPSQMEFSINTHGGRMNQNLGEPISQAETNIAADQLGFTYIRQGVEWFHVEKSAGVFNFAFYVDQFAGLQDRGIKPMITLAYGNPVHTQWLDHDPWWVYPPKSAPEIAAWKNYCVKVAEVFGPDCPYEVWNEQNSNYFWREFADLDEYMAVFNAAAQAVRSVWPNAHIMLGGVVGTAGAMSDVLDATQFIKDCIAYPGRERIDSIAYHYYTTGDLAPWDASNWNFAEPTQGLHSPEQVIAWVPQLRDDIDDPPIPIISTECGYPITNSQHYSSERQGVLNSRLMLSGYIAGIAGFHNIYDMIDDASNIYDPQGGYGQYDYWFNIKPSGIAYGAVTKAFKDVTGPITHVAAGTAYPGQIYTLFFPKADRIVAITWSNGIVPTPYTVTFPAAVTASTAKDLMGVTVDKTVSGSTVTVQLCNGYYPTIIEVNGPNNSPDRNSVNLFTNADDLMHASWTRYNLTSFDEVGFTGNDTGVTDFFGTKKALKFLAPVAGDSCMLRKSLDVPDGTYRVELDLLYNPQYDSGIGNFVEGAPFTVWLAGNGSSNCAVSVTCKRGWQRLKGTWVKSGSDTFVDIRCNVPGAVLWIANPLLTAAL